MPKNKSVQINRKNDTIPLNEKNRIIIASQDENGTTQPQSDDGTMDVKDLFQVSIEWKFECESCHRYIVINLKVCLSPETKKWYDKQNNKKINYD